MRGDGRIYQKPGSRFLHYEFWIDSTAQRGSTREADPERAWRVLRRKIEAARRGDAVAGEDRITLADLFKLIEENYTLRRNRSIGTMRYSFNHLLDYFGKRTKAVKLGYRLDDYVTHRRTEGAADASVRIELALLDRAFRLAVKKRLLSHRCRPEIEKPADDPSRVRKGFFTREQVETLCGHLPAPVADLVLFLFFSAWRVGEARRIEWKHYAREDAAISLPAEFSKNKRPRLLPITGELAAIIERRLKARRLDCPFIFHRNGRRVGDFRKLWAKACTAIGIPGRIVHDLRRSGVKHLIDSGVDPHTVMAFSGHRTPSMLRRYHIIDLDDLRRAAERASSYQGRRANVTPLRPEAGTRTEPAQDHVFSRPASEAGSVRG